MDLDVRGGYDFYPQLSMMSTREYRFQDPSQVK